MKFGRWQWVTWKESVTKQKLSKKPEEEWLEMQLGKISYCASQKRGELLKRSADNKKLAGWLFTDKAQKGP